MPGGEERTGAQNVIPAPPEGYARPYRLGQSWLLLSVAGVVLGLGAVAAGLSLSPWFPASGSESSLTSRLAVLILGGGVVATVLSHELVHGLAYRFYGYEVSYSADALRGTFTTAAPGQFHTRREAIRIALAPLLLLTPLALALVVAPVLELSLFGLVVLVVNCSGSVADLHLGWRLRSLPGESLLCDGDATYVYEPLARRPTERK